VSMLRRNRGWKTMSESASGLRRPWIACERRCSISRQRWSDKKSGGSRGANSLALCREECFQAKIGKIEQLDKITPVERFAFGRRLNLDERPISCPDDIAVNRSGAVLDIVEIENRHAAHDADADRGDGRRQRVSI